ncbi:MAG: hypothetical protein KGL17_02865 [Betaproteobacteria bacterium]|nr:hypothetical protein [Betaproteobacteria bacterium]
MKPLKPTLVLLQTLALAMPALAQASEDVLPAFDGGSPGGVADGGDFFKNWFARSDAAKESQPHWMTPVVTVTPRLEQEYRYDQLQQYKSGGAQSSNYGLNKGLELITSANTELIVGQPGYVVNNAPKGVSVSGWADETFLLKYRLLSANEESGNYIVTAFMGVSVPTGDPAITTNHYLYTPTLAAGKGWGTRESGFDIQSTLSMTVPDRDMARLGEPIVWNTAFQGHFSRYWWPAIETQLTHFSSGPNNGRNQTVLTPELIVGRFHVTDRLNFVLGAGYEKTVGGFRTFNNAWQLTARTPF